MKDFEVINGKWVSESIDLTIKIPEYVKVEKGIDTNDIANDRIKNQINGTIEIDKTNALQLMIIFHNWDSFLVKLNEEVMELAKPSNELQGGDTTILRFRRVEATSQNG